MSDAHKDILRKNREAITTNINIDRVLTILYSDYIISADDEDGIRSEKTRHDRNRELLNVLQRKPDSAFEGILDNCCECV